MITTRVTYFVLCFDAVGTGNDGPVRGVGIPLLAGVGRRLRAGVGNLDAGPPKRGVDDTVA